jgi:hypothetical protein
MKARAFQIAVALSSLVMLVDKFTFGKKWG